MDHTFEEIRQVALDIIAGGEKIAYDADQYEHLRISVAEVIARRHRQ